MTGYRVLVVFAVMTGWLISEAGSVDSLAAQTGSPSIVSEPIKPHVVAPTVKPTTPIKVSVQPETPPVAGKPVDFIVRAVSDIATQKFTIIVQPPAGATVQSGSLVWEGAAASGETKTLRFSLLLPTQGASVVSAIARIRASNGSQLAARAVYQNGNSAVAASLTKSIAKTTVRGNQRIVEYPLR